MPRHAEKLRDRFKPNIFERLEQSREARARRRIADKVTPTVPAPVGQSTFGSLIHSNIERQSIRVWHEWGTQLTTQSTCATNDPWDVWTSQIVTMRYSTASATTAVWRGWNDETSRPAPRQIITPEEQRRRQAEEARYVAERAAANEAANARYYEERRAADNRRKEADDRAMVLLVSMLNSQQRDDLKKNNYFFVEAPSGRLYRIDYGTHGNVKVVDRNTRKVIERLCIQPNGVPAGDANLMQKLLIETAEDLFRSHANITLEDGRLLQGKIGLLDNVELAKVIPLRRAA